MTIPQYECEYGHFDCATRREGGPCTDECRDEAGLTTGAVSPIDLLNERKENRNA
ncbi:MAG: hypothetical protein ACYS7Y_30515 [Planctomycetota bacterium]|jgi:hypothetical protein